MRKIRDAIAPPLLDIAEPLRRLSMRGERILATHTAEARAATTRLDEQDRFADAVRLTSRMTAFVEELASLLQQLESIDIRARGRGER